MPLLSTFGAASTRGFGGIGAAAAGAGLDVDEVFSTHLYDGTGAAQTITNNIDLSGEGGLVWTKFRTNQVDHILFDTERGALQKISSNLTDASVNDNNTLTSFNSNGFSLGNRSLVNQSGQDFVSWTFRKSKNFFTMVTWSGNSTMGRTISHDLGADVGLILIKAVDKADAWYALHKDSNMLVLNQTTGNYSDATTADYFGDGTSIVRPTSTEFTIGSDAGINGTGYNYIAYLFAHNDGDGEFGPDADQDVIKCGSYTGNGSNTGPTINLGFEPQFLMVKRTDSSRNWNVYDSIRDFNTNSSAEVSWNLSSAEQFRGMSPTSTGFQPKTTSAQINASGGNYIYMAIRRGPLAEPTDATKVFSIDSLGSSAPYFDSNHIVDMALVRPLGFSGSGGGGAFNYARLMGEKYLKTSGTNAEANASEAGFDFMNGHIDQNWGGTNTYSWMWKRAPGYFDTVAYTSNTTYPNTFSHNLGVVPEMIWIKKRTSAANWAVYHSALGNTKHLTLNTAAAESASSYWNNTSPTASVVTVGGQDETWGYGNYQYIAHLFATVVGVSKVGSYSGTGSTQTIDCGFSSGARFVLIKCTNDTENWIVFDSERGIVSGNDSYFNLNTADAQITSSDFIDPVSSGFAVNTNSGEVNNSSNTYIFYAIA